MKKYFKNIVICGAAGKIAQLFLKSIKNDFNFASIVGIDCTQSSSPSFYEKYIFLDLNSRESLENTKECFLLADLILLALPAHIAIKVLDFLAAQHVTGAVIVETLSVKSQFYEHLTYHKNNGYSPEVIGVNPLFRPDIGFLNNNVLYLTQNPSEKTAVFLQFLKNTGAKCLQVNINTHEEKMAIVQAGTHAIALIYGMLLKEYGYHLSEYLPFSTPVHRHLLQLLSRIISGEPHVYEEIQTENAHSALVRKSIIHLAAKFNNLINDEINFDQLFLELREVLGDHQLLLATECQQSIALQSSLKEPLK